MAEEIEDITVSSDDCDETAGGTVEYTDTKAELLSPISQWGVGLRFQNVNIPQGATISDAELKLAIWWVCGAAGNCHATIYGVDLDNSDTWRRPVDPGGENKPSDQPQTNESVAWDMVTNAVQANTFYYFITHDITAIVQEIVNRPGWNSGNSMSFVIQCGSFGRAQHIDIWTVDSAYPEGRITVNYVSPKSRINIGDNFKDIIQAKINIGDVWKDVTEIKQNIGDVWKDVPL